MNAELSSTLLVPTQATASAFSPDGRHLAVGSDDGSVRIYQPPETKVQKAIRGLDASVSCVLFHASSGDDIWIAAGKSISRFDLTSPKMILSRLDAMLLKDIGQDDEDVVNQVARSANHAYLACTTDAGGVYILDITSGEVSKMKTNHNSIAWTASFIPERPSELLTGGYDCALLLHDFKLRTLLARFDLTPEPALAPGISSLPPFITSLTLSPQGAVAVGTADGRIWIGLGGAKTKTSLNSSSASSGKKGKRSKKWGGLDSKGGFFTKIGESLITGLEFVDTDVILSCTLHGKLALHRLVPSVVPIAGNTSRPQQDTEGVNAPPPGGLQTLWTGQSECAKVDALSVSARPSDSEPLTSGEKLISVVVAGLHADNNRGAVEMWTLRTSGEGLVSGDSVVGEARAEVEDEKKGCEAKQRDKSVE